MTATTTRHAIHYSALSETTIHWECVDCPVGGLRPTHADARAHAYAAHAPFGVTALDTTPDRPAHYAAPF